MENILKNLLLIHQSDFHPVVDFDESSDRIAPIDLSAKNSFFTADIYNDPSKFSRFIKEKQEAEQAKYLVGGYRELRGMYSRSSLFDQDLSRNEMEIEEPRTLHIGTDIWAEAGTKVYAPLGGMVHSFAFNNHFGDYGVTIILQHQLETINFYTLYGHLSLKDLKDKRVGQFLTRGENFAHFGPWEENGNWPPHLHFQLILDIGLYEGDYPGVCKLSEAAKYLQNCPDPDLILKMKPSL